MLNRYDQVHIQTCANKCFCKHYLTAILVGTSLSNLNIISCITSQADSFLCIHYHSPHTSHHTVVWYIWNWKLVVKYWQEHWSLHTVKTKWWYLWQSSEGHYQRKLTSLEVVVMFTYFCNDLHHLATDITVLFLQCNPTNNTIITASHCVANKMALPFDAIHKNY